MSQSARNLVAGKLNNEDIINTLAVACTGQNLPDTPAQYRSSDEEVSSLFNSGKTYYNRRGSRDTFNYAKSCV